MAVLSEVVGNDVNEASLLRSDDVFEQGLNSQTSVDFVRGLNQSFSEVNITTDDVLEHRTVSKISQFISAFYSGDVKKFNPEKPTPYPLISRKTKTTVDKKMTVKPHTLDQKAVCLQFNEEDTSTSINSGFDEVLELVKRATQDIFPKSVEVTQETIQTGFIEMGLDSLAVIDLVSRLNEKYFPNLGLSTTDIFDYPSIKELSEYIQRKKATIDSSKEKTLNRSKKIIFNQVLNLILQATQDILPKSVDVTEETMHTGFMELGLDSLAVIDLISRLNEKYLPTIHLSTNDIFDYPSIYKLAEHICTMEAVCNQEDELCHSKASFFPASEARIHSASNDNSPNRVITDYSSFSTAYLEILDSKDVKANILLSINNSGDLFLMSLLTSRKIVFKPDDEVVSCEQLKELLPVRSVIRFSSDSVIQPVQLFSALLFLSRILLSTCLEVSVTISKLPTLANTLARSFFKTLAAEKYPKVQFVYEERLLEVRIPNYGISTKIGGKWLITGGLSGIGLTIARWLADECDAEYLVLVSRRRQYDTNLVQEIEQLRKKTHVIVISANIADYNTLQAELSSIPFKLTGVIHSAGVLHDAIMERQCVNAFLEVFRPKGEGYHVIDRILEENHHNVDYFVVMSSFTVVCGNAGQLNYAVANAYLDHQMYLRRKSGKPGTTIHWGNWIDVGMAKRVQKMMTELGFLGLTNKEALAFMRYAIIHKPLKLVAARLDWNTVLQKRPDIRKDIVMKANGDWDISRTDNGIYLSEPANDVANANAEQTDAVINNTSPKKHNQTMLKTTLTRSRRPTSENLSSQSLSRSLKEYVSLTNHYTVESHVQYITEKTTTNKLSKIQLNICNIFGLNVFFDDEDDFYRSVTRDIEYLTNSHRSSMPTSFEKRHAIHVIGNSIAEVVSKLKTLKFKKSERSIGGKSVMLFAGQGAQYPLMGKQLSTLFPVFKKEFERCLNAADSLMEDIPLSNIIDNVTDITFLHRTKYVQPIMFAFGYACATLWRSLGFEPDFYLGHSVGELVAGVMAGMMTLEDGIRLVVERGIAMENIANRGALLAIDSEAKEEVLGKFNVTLAAINSPKQIVIAGIQKELVNVLEYIEEKNIYGTFVSIKYPFHSSLITEDDVKGLRKILQTVNFKQARKPIVSNVTGKLITTFSEEYLIQHTLSPVKLVDCVHTLKSLGVTAWVEAGPSNTITSFVQRTLSFDTLVRHDIMQTASDSGEEARYIVATALVLEARGLPIRWEHMYQCENEDVFLDKPLTLLPEISNGTITEGDYAVLKNHRIKGENVVPESTKFTCC
ncbi:hypothetical protein KIN20_018448 [Parelaphostrongylus tenuis]|uniref:Fatty acid synthase n=1 Tax=Parelaphostrongylus tenuis TaxID=148309 RepID=A0AAD5QS49_PARTN|nr:hypothetical protein KIN20_018448 [Parelaphostrongylus tenuis]